MGDDDHDDDDDGKNQSHVPTHLSFLSSGKSVQCPSVKWTRAIKVHHDVAIDIKLSIYKLASDNMHEGWGSISQSC